MLRKRAVDYSPLIADKLVAKAVPCWPVFAFGFARITRINGERTGKQPGKNKKDNFDDGAM